MEEKIKENAIKGIDKFVDKVSGMADGFSLSFIGASILLFFFLTSLMMCLRFFRGRSSGKCMCRWAEINNNLFWVRSGIVWLYAGFCALATTAHGMPFVEMTAVGFVLYAVLFTWFYTQEFFFRLFMTCRCRRGAGGIIVDDVVDTAGRADDMTVDLAPKHESKADKKRAEQEELDREFAKAAASLGVDMGENTKSESKNESDNAEFIEIPLIKEKKPRANRENPEKAKKPTEKVAKSAQKPLESDEKTTEIDDFLAQINEKTAEFNEKLVKNKGKIAENDGKKDGNVEKSHTETAVNLAHRSETAVHHETANKTITSATGEKSIASVSQKSTAGATQKTVAGHTSSRATAHKTAAKPAPKAAPKPRGTPRVKARPITAEPADRVEIQARRNSRTEELGAKIERQRLRAKQRADEVQTVEIPYSSQTREGMQTVEALAQKMEQLQRKREELRQTVTFKDVSTTETRTRQDYIKKTVAELRNEQADLKRQYEAMYTRLEQMKTDSFADRREEVYSTSGARNVNIRFGARSRFDEKEVAEALLRLKIAISELQARIDAQNNTN
jgi:hypothetical protein